MSTLSRDEIASLAKNAGFTGNDVNIAVAVALAESGGNPDAHNTKAPDDSYGLWQINMYGSLGPSRRAALKLGSDSELFTPATNARAAKMVFDGQGWNGWSTYKTGAYKKYLDSSSGGSGGGVGSAIGSITGISDVASSINSLGKNLFNGLASVVAVIVALVLLALGVLMLLRNKLPAGKIAKIAGKVVK